MGKTWLKVHEEQFTLLRDQDNEMYVALNKVIEAKKGERKSGGVAGRSGVGASDQPRLPAYHQVIQKTGSDSSQPLVYQYSAAAGATVETLPRLVTQRSCGRTNSA